MKHGMIAIITILAALWMHFNGIPDFLIPGKPEITKAAVTAMVGNIKNGVDLDDAVITFGKMILDGAEILY